MQFDDEDKRGDEGAPLPADPATPSPEAGSGSGSEVTGPLAGDTPGTGWGAEPAPWAPPAADPTPQTSAPAPKPFEPAPPPVDPWAPPSTQRAAPQPPPAWQPPAASPPPAPWTPPAPTWAPPPPPSSWQAPQSSGWAQPRPPQWGTPPSQPAWPPQPPAAPAWPPQVPPAPPVWQPGSAWQGGQQPPPFDGSGMAPAGAGIRRRPSRLPGYLAIVAACLIAFSGGMVVDHSLFPRTVTAADQPSSTASSSAQDAALYNEALQIVKDHFVGRASVTDQQLLYGALKGLVDSLGDTGHSTFLTPQEYAAFQQSLSASVAGIGVVMSTANGVFRVDKVIAGSPAATGGVKVGDTITAVDGTSTTDMTMNDVGTKIRGTAGTKVTITVIHAGSTTPVDLTLTRANIDVPLAEWGMVPGTKTADIVLNEFSSGAADQVQADITAATKAGATSIVFDLRGNPGGYADEAQAVASEFMSSGIVYIQQDANGNNTDISVDTSRKHTDLPMVVLVDHDSASSAEIVAGALQDSGRAKVVGVSTFGTGTVLQSFNLSDGSVIILGTSWWLTPHGNKIFGVGIKPDETVAMAAGTVPVDPTTLPTMTVAQLNASGDAELLAAVKDLSN
jgi:carboxyl-terminal processing protease